MIYHPDKTRRTGHCMVAINACGQRMPCFGWNYQTVMKRLLNNGQTIFTHPNKTRKDRLPWGGH